MDGFKKRTAKKRAAILRAVLSLMMEKQSTFTIQDVAMAASVSPVSIYNYFGSKEQLMLAALELSMEEQIEEIDREMSRHCPFEELLRRILMKKIDHAAMFDSVLIDLVTTNEALQHMTKIGYASLLRLIDYGRTEGAMCAAADGFSRATGEATATSGTAGPGFTHMIMNIAAANAARTPLSCTRRAR